MSEVFGGTHRGGTVPNLGKLQLFSRKQHHKWHLSRAGSQLTEAQSCSNKSSGTGVCRLITIMPTNSSTHVCCSLSKVGWWRARLESPAVRNTSIYHCIGRPHSLFRGREGGKWRKRKRLPLTTLIELQSVLLIQLL